MIRSIDRLAGTHYDLLVIGGGINGAAIANIAAGRGLKVALVEKNDFASGTSSKSTKLVHGGIRYLENFEFDLVGEALHERHIQLRCAPHLVKPLQFLIPVYRGDKRPLWMMRLGVYFYDRLSGKYSIGRPKSLSKNDVLRLEPNLKKEGLKGGVTYFDAQMDDARLCLENVLTAAQKGADVANYVKVVSFMKEDGRAVGVKACDSIKDVEFEIHADKIIGAVGPWTNYLLRLDDPSAKKHLRTTKGVHIVYPGEISKNALLIPSDSDKRIFFVMPWMGNSLIGTTDTDSIKNPDRIKADDADIDYLFCAAKRVFPNIDFKKERIITTFAGLRPLIRRGGIAPSKVSRKHVTFKTQSGIVFVIGGKYTTYRKIAQDCVNNIAGTREAKDEKEYPLYGGGGVANDFTATASWYSLSLETLKMLAGKYGARYVDVLSLTEESPHLKETFCRCNPFIKAQIIYSIKVEMAQTAEDIIDRRLSLNYLPCATKNCRKVIESYFASR